MIIDDLVQAGDFGLNANMFFNEVYGDKSFEMPQTQPFWNLWDVAEIRAGFYPASAKHHGVWFGGLNDHMNDVLIYMWSMMKTYRITLEPVLIPALALLHDWEKLFKYRLVEQNFSWEHRAPESMNVAHMLRIGAFATWAGLPVNEEFLNALTMGEGGWSLEARAGDRTESSPAATLLHAADMFSAKIRRKTLSEWARRINTPSEVAKVSESNIVKASPIEKVLWPS